MSTNNQEKSVSGRKERPILFSGPMVQAILDGRKTQTRRVCKARDGITVHPNGQVLARGGFLPELSCPYGQPGDRLWVRETWVRFDGTGPRYLYAADKDHDGSVPYLHTGAGGFGGGVASCNVSRWSPSIHMPRWASRITLEIESVRVERLQEISEDDARAEGWHPSDGQGPCEWYQDLWDSINAKRGFGWDTNPWVWVIQFKRV